MQSTSTTVSVKDKEFELLISEQEIRAKVAEVAQQINADYQGKNPLLIGVLNGSFIFAADLAREIEIDAEFSFIRAASYEGTKSTGELKQILGLSDNIFRRDIIIIEDIIDSGHTMETILNHFNERGVKSVAVCSLLVKPQSLTRPLDIQYKCFEISDEFVVGYGLDYDGQGRHLKDIYQLPTN